MKKTIIAGALVASLGIASIASATGVNWGGEPKPLSPEQLKSPAQTLNLSDEQLTKLRQIQQENFQETSELRNQLQQKMFELNQLQLQKNPDQEKVKAKVQEINDLRTKLYELRKQNRNECQSILTDEQRAKLGQACKNGDGICGFGCSRGFNKQ